MPSAGGNGADPAPPLATGRPDLVDRNGEVLATDIKMASLFAEPRNILDPDEATELITSVLPDLDAAAIRKKLCRRRRLRLAEARDHARRSRPQIHALGIPGIGFLRENKRFYPGGPTAAHLIGLVNIDNQGIAGIEKYVDDHWSRAICTRAGFARGERPRAGQAVDRRRASSTSCATSSSGAMERYQAIAATGIILNVHTGEVLAMASLPDYDPNDPVDALKPDRLNRMSRRRLRARLGVQELHLRHGARLRQGGP